MPKPTRTLDKTYTEEPPQDGERSVTLRRVGDVGMVAAMYHIPSGGHDDFAALDVLANILSAAPSGRLYKALVETKKATDVSASAANWHDPGVFDVDVEVRKGDSLEAASDTMLDDRRKGRRRAAVPKPKSNGPSSNCSNSASWPRPTPAASPCN